MAVSRVLSPFVEQVVIANRYRSKRSTTHT